MFCSLDVDEAFFPKFLFSALGLKLNASASSDFLEALGKERDFCDGDDDDDDSNNHNNKAFWKRCFSGTHHHCLILPTICTIQGWPISLGQP